MSRASDGDPWRRPRPGAGRATAPGHQGGRSVNISLQQHQILDVADLASLPKGRIVLFATGARPVLVKRVPFWEMPYAQQVTESIGRYGPGETPPADGAPAAAASSNPWVR